MRKAPKKHSSGAEQVAEKGPISGEIRRMHTSGAKAQALFCGVYGTTEVVPFRTSTSSGFFFAACEARADSVGFMRGLKTPASLRREFLRSL
jgi:hypothetical protein